MHLYAFLISYVLNLCRFRYHLVCCRILSRNKIAKYTFSDGSRDDEHIEFEYKYGDLDRMVIHIENGKHVTIVHKRKMINITPTVYDLALCSYIAEDMINHTKLVKCTEDLSDEDKLLTDYVCHLDGELDHNMHILFMLIISHSKFRTIGKLKDFRIKDVIVDDIMNFLERYMLDAMRIANYLGMYETIDALLARRIKVNRDHFSILHHNIEGWDIVECSALGIPLIFDGVIKEIKDRDIFRDALENNMLVEEIHDGKYLSDSILERCNNIRILNVNGNPYVTKLEHFSNTLTELHCENRSGIRQNQIDLCLRLERLYVTHNPHITRCYSKYLTVLHVGGKHGIDNRFIMSCENLIELGVMGRSKILLPPNVSRLCLDTDAFGNFTKDLGQLEYLKIIGSSHNDDNRIISITSNTIIVSSNLRTLILKKCSALPAMTIDNAINLETLICDVPESRMFPLSQLKHLEMDVTNFRSLYRAYNLETLKVRRFDHQQTHNSSYYNFDSFEKLHTLEYQGRVDLTSYSHLKKLTCQCTRGEWPKGIEVIIQDYNHSHRYTDYNEYLEDFVDGQYDPRYQTATYISTEGFRKGFRYNYPNIKRINTRLSFNSDIAIRSLRAFSNLIDLYICLKEDDIMCGSIIDCHNVPLLRKLRLENVKASNLDILSKLEIYHVTAYHLKRNKSIDVTIVNPLLRILILYQEESIDTLYVKSRWIDTIKTRRLKRLICDSNVSNLDTAFCLDVEPIGAYSFVCLSKYRGASESLRKAAIEYDIRQYPYTYRDKSAKDIFTSLHHHCGMCESCKRIPYDYDDQL